MQIFSQGTHLYMSLFLSACPSVCPYICCAPYLRNCTSCDHNSWYTWVRWWYLQVFFFIYLKFWFFGLLKAKKYPKMTKNPVCLTPHPHIFVHMCKMMISPAISFIFSKFWFFRILCRGEGGGGGGKREKSPIIP